MGVEDEAEHNHNGEKTSVLKKVKDKAKKIKDTIKKPGGHGHEHDYRHDQISEEEDDEDEEMVDAPEVLCAPMYESEFISGTNLPRQSVLSLEKQDKHNSNVRDEIYPDVGQTWSLPEDTQGLPVGSEVHPDIGIGGETTAGGVREDQYSRNVGDIAVTGTPERALNRGTELETSQMETPQPEVKNPLPTGTGAIGLEKNSVVEPMVKIGPLVDLEEDPHSPKNRLGETRPSNYQTKVVSPTGEGGKEAEVAPLIGRLGNLHVGDESESNSGLEQRCITGSHEQFAPQSTPINDMHSSEANRVVNSKDSESPKSSDPAKPESMPCDTVAGKIPSATSVIADKAVTAKNVVASKLGYGGSQHDEGQHSPKKASSESTTEYGYKIAEKLAPIYEKVAGVGSALMSKVQRGGGAKHQDRDIVAKGTDKGVSVKEYLAEKFSPGDDDEALSEVITNSIHKKRPRDMAEGGRTVD